MSDTMQLTRNQKPNPGREKAYRTALIITLTGNILLAIVKGIASYMTGSIALYADAANSISDVVYSLALVFALKVILQPPDLSHPQGHARFEPLVALGIALMMSIAGYEALRASIERFIAGGIRIEPGLPTVVLLASAAVKAGMFFSIMKLAKKTESPSLRMSAADNLSDVLTSTAAFLGILGSNFIHPVLDPIAGVLVSLWIFKAVFDAGRENLSYLTGAGADEALRQKIIDTANQVEGNHQVHHMVSEYVGPKLVIDMHINLPGEVSLEEAHDVSDRVTEALEDLPEVDRAYIHAEPNE